ncbi:MAG: hypothetical protein PHP22_09065 [Oscillospiraceae bacterium]|nr:hypothetical protein [Oscillospiraceae bacterium]
MNEFEANNLEILRLLDLWVPRLLALSEEELSARTNSQGRTARKIIGHMVDSAANNTQRIIWLQLEKSPLLFPDYAQKGNNDRFIAAQNYRDEDAGNLIRLFQYANLHLVHVIRNVDPSELDNEWIDALGERVSLRVMILDYLRHFELHLREIEELIPAES